MENEAVSDVITLTTLESRCDEFSNCEVAETAAVSCAPLALVQDNTGKESSVRDQPAGEYSESPSDMRDSGNTTIIQGANTRKSPFQISNDVGSWKSLSASETDSVVIMGPQRPPES